MMNLPSQEIWYVGDSIETDINGAMDADLFTIWFNQVNNHTDKLKAHIEISKLADLIELIKKSE